MLDGGDEHGKGAEGRDDGRRRRWVRERKALAEIFRRPRVVCRTSTSTTVAGGEQGGEFGIF